MQIADGVQLHFIEDNKLKTNHITFRFSGDFSQKTVAKRVLVGQMLETANETYPTTQAFRKKLTSLYGAELSTTVSTRGKVHIVDIDVTFIKDKFTFKNESLIEEVMDFLKNILFYPLISVAQYQTKTFEREQANLIHYLQVDKEDPFYSSELALQELYFNDSTLRLSKYSNKDFVSRETAYTVYQEFKKMLLEDQIDIFFVGEFDSYKIIQNLYHFPLENRKKVLEFTYSQPYSNVTREKLESKEFQQSVLQIAYNIPISYQDSLYFALIVFNGLLGGFSHSKLFLEVREREGLAYSISSQFNIFTGLLTVTTAIDSKNRNKTLQLINKQLMDIRRGRFSMEMIRQTKKMLQTNRVLSTDYVKSRIDYLYNETYLEDYTSLTEWLTGVDKVSKGDIMLVASKVKLQAFYFVEGDT